MSKISKSQKAKPTSHTWVKFKSWLNLRNPMEKPNAEKFPYNEEARDYEKENSQAEKPEEQNKKLKQLSYLFPYSSFRPIQEELADSVAECVKNRQSLIAHAPTGLGKTAAVLSPALAYALKNKKTVFFLTSRHTQHMLAIKTLKEIKERHSLSLSAVDIIGKKWMCPLSEGSTMPVSDLKEFCRKLKENKECSYYSNIREKGKLSLEAKKAISELKATITDSKSFYEACKARELCPYELSLVIAESSNVIIADYYYLFNPAIMKNFLQRTKIELEDCIIIVDEGHNLPLRIRDLATAKLGLFQLKRAQKEALKFGYRETWNKLENIKKAITELSNNIGRSTSKNSINNNSINNNGLGRDELIISKNALIEAIEKKEDLVKLIFDLNFIADEIRSQKKASYIGSIASFLEYWQTDDNESSFTRILRKKRQYSKARSYDNSYATSASKSNSNAFGLEKETEKSPSSLSEEAFELTISKVCLDSSIISKEIVNGCHSCILMSGTLTPTKMYKDLLGFENCIEKAFTSPFSEKNRLNIIIPKASTKYKSRTQQEFNKIAGYCSEIVNEINGNSIVFFPSYYMLDKIAAGIEKLSKKTILKELPEMRKEDKEKVLSVFKSYKDTGAVLLAVVSGSFSEGIDLPGDLLKCVIVVGLPLQPPDLETKELINYYDSKFGKGWEYGYIYPAFNKALQSAGRCIRTEKDKGIVVFLDERYLWPKYFKLFPPELKIVIKNSYLDEIRGFLKKNSI